MNQDPGFRLGVVEGFFGRQWSWEARQTYAAFLARHGCNSYVYAPKNDPWFRKQWQEPCPASHVDALTALRASHARAGIDFGIGFSPFELYRDFSPRNRELLLRKLDEIDAIAPTTLYVLFDDMMGDLSDLAKVQLDIMDCIVAHSGAGRFALCPTYYSSDPVLVRHFGAEPQHYLEDLGAGLDASIEIFWTGPKVISASYPRAHLLEVADKLRRPPLLWDNYPVNDAKRLTSFLHLAPFTGRDAELRELVSGHLANPMNEAWLSQLPLYSLPLLYGASPYDAERVFEEACAALCPPDLAAALLEDAGSFQSEGLDKLDASRKAGLLAKYGAIAHPMAEEVCAWLRGEYVFDPACLT